jgi:hypothetical protein
LKWEDQEKIRQKIQSFLSTGGVNTPVQDVTPVLKVKIVIFRATYFFNLKVELAKSAMGKCQLCKDKIGKGELRVASKAQFYHTKCFAEKFAEGRTIDDFYGFDELSDEQKEEFSQHFPSGSRFEHIVVLQHFNKLSIFLLASVSLTRTHPLISRSRNQIMLCKRN